MPLPKLPEVIVSEDPKASVGVSLTDFTYHKLGLRTIAARAFLELALRHVILFDNKQLDYGPRNISKFGTYGVVVRMSDKFERIANLYRQGKKRRAVNESIRDTFSDVAIYGLIALMVDAGVWPESEVKL